jgi:UDP-N-acetylmuramoyl-tripeptide--D-alanyl-D-alanine ligase
VKATNGNYAGAEMVMTGVSTDSREKLNGKLFIALKGERMDAHQFVAAAIGNGASAVMVHEDLPEFAALKSKAAFFFVNDTLKGLQDLAKFWRVKHDFLTIGITGSNGKTSTKEFLYALIKDFKPTVASKGSFNNHWGVPLSILSAGPDCEILILEMGMNHLGELTTLVRIAQPDIVGVTMVGRSHIGELGSQENVAKAKQEIYFASPSAIGIYNVDNQWTRAMYADAKISARSRMITFSSHVPRSDVSIRAERLTSDAMQVTGEIGGVKGVASVKVFGRHNIVNLEAAAAFAWAAGMTPEAIWKKLNGLEASSWGRNQWIKMPTGTMVLFDGYNANPESMTALLKNLYELEAMGKKFLILGEMLELGSESPSAHREIGELVGKINVDGLWFIGEHHKDVETGLRSTGFANPAFFSDKFDPAISQQIKSELSPQDVVAIKASRGTKLETVLEHWGLQP